MALIVNGCAGGNRPASDLPSIEAEAYTVLLDQLTQLASNGPVRDHNVVCVHVLDADGRMHTLENRVLIDALRDAVPVDAQIQLVDAASCIKDSDGNAMTSASEPARALFARKLQADERANWMSGFSHSAGSQWTYYKVDIRNGEPAATATGGVNWD